MNRTNAILAAVALLLAALLWLDRNGETPAELITLTERDPGEIRQIALHLGDGEAPAVLLQKQDSGWHITHPVQVAADPFAVGEILRLLRVESHEQRDPEGLDLAALKLAPPLWRVAYDDSELAIGAVESIRRQRYVLQDGRVHLVDDFNPAPFDGNYADLVSRRLLPAGSDILRIRWPDQAPAAADALDPLRLQHWLDAEADWTARPLPVDFEAVHSRVTITTTQGTADFLIAGVEPRLKLIRPDIDVLYNLPASAVAELLGP